MSQRYGVQHTIERAAEDRPGNGASKRSLRVLGVVVALGALGTALSYQSQAPTLDIPFGPRVVLGQPGLNGLGMTIVALVTAPMALVGAALGLGGRTRGGLSAGGLNLIYALGIVALALASLRG